MPLYQHAHATTWHRVAQQKHPAVVLVCNTAKWFAQTSSVLTLQPLSGHSAVQAAASLPRDQFLLPAVVDGCSVLIFANAETTNHVSKTCLDRYTKSILPNHCFLFPHHWLLSFRLGDPFLLAFHWLSYTASLRHCPLSVSVPPFFIRLHALFPVSASASSQIY